MQRNLTIIVLLLFATALAVIPVLGMRWLVRAQAIGQAEHQLEATAQRTMIQVDGLLAEASDVLASVISIAREACGPDQRAKLASTAFAARAVKAILILGPDGNTICSSSEIPANNLLGLRFRQARQKNLSIGVNGTGTSSRSLLNIRTFDGDRMVIATVLLDAQRIDYVPSDWRMSATGLITFDDGTLIASLPYGGDDAARAGDGAEVLTAQANSERFPIRVSVSVPATTILASTRVLSMLVNLGGGLLGILFFLLVAQASWRRPSVEDAIARGIRRDEFIPYYQPVFDIQSGEVTGCEVLIRWRKSDGTIVPPGAFIREAEESGLAIDMTHQLMRKVRDEVGQYYATRPELKVAINLFADHFSDFSIVDDVRDIFAEGGIRYTQLVFEVTERYPLLNLARAKLAIQGLQNLGCRVALDDAGTGHGGLAYLQTLGMDQIKIDKLFVDAITAENTASPIIDSLIELSRSLNMEIVAEGLETREQLHYLQARGVHFAQGYLFSKPLPGESYIQLLLAISNNGTRKLPSAAPQTPAAKRGELAA